jgi:3-deoxy-manno-octulosonate cytidylyltransferase (CMP-KDO synthetase)
MNPTPLLIIIPARYASTRFPGKPLADINGKPMVQHVYERCVAARPDAQVLVATDDVRIEHAVREFGGEAFMTPASLQSGSERAAWVARELGHGIVVNVQGDEPLLPAETLDAAIAPLLTDDEVDIGTAACVLDSPIELADPNIVKVVLDYRRRALYFSRAPIPHVRDGKSTASPYLRHVGIYAFRREALLRFADLPQGQLEVLEKLEQLRALEHGMRIGVGITSRVSQAVDTPADLERVKAMLL